MELQLIYKDGTLSQEISNMNEKLWIHLAVVANGDSSNDGGYVYINGGSTSYEITGEAGDVQNEDGNLRINEEGKAVATYVDELTFWNSALSKDEVEMLYNS